ncbi:MAG: DUF4174 domain-containing protein [Pseudomonadota bacterium]
MRLLISVVYLIPMIITQVHSEDLKLDNLDELRWNSRIILVKSGSDIDKTLLILEKAKNEIDERHINWFVFTNDQTYTNLEIKLGNHFNEDVLDTYFNGEGLIVIVLGKDGYVKQRSRQLNLPGIFELIDSMPMRQIEMSSQSK